MFIANDLTKLYEWTFEGEVGAALAEFEGRENKEKGEYCVAIKFPQVERAVEAVEPIRAETWVLDALQRGLTIAEAVEFARSRGVTRNDAYKASLAVRQFLSHT
ncbi:hypothetical protein FACS1894184_20900 [Clostridia bacterium]|nr:hypothetical protein FACS1894184_20900 [Clostridia bacterium]